MAGAETTTPGDVIALAVLLSVLLWATRRAWCTAQKREKQEAQRRAAARGALHR